MAKTINEIHDELHAAINEIDAVLDSQGDPTAATRRKLMNEYIDVNEKVWAAVVAQLTAKIETLPEEQQIGFYYGLTRQMSKTLSEPISKKLDILVENAPKPEQAEKLDEATLKEFSTSRSDLYQKIKNLIETAKNFDADEGMYMPSKRTGGRGPRGKRAVNYITWTIDGEGFENLKAVVEKYDQYTKVSELTAAIKAADINLTTPPEVIDFNLPDGKVLHGVYSPPTNSTEVVEGDEPDDDDDDDEVEDDE